MNEGRHEGNVDAWLSAIPNVEMKDTLAFLRDKYLTALGSSTEELIHSQLYEAINEFYKV